MQQALIQSVPSSHYKTSWPVSQSSGFNHHHHRHGKLLLGGINRSSFISQRRIHFCEILPARSRPSSAINISCKIATITQDSFSDEVINSEVPVLVGFCADWCGPCKLIAPIMETVAKDFGGTLKAVKIDTDSSPDLVKEYDVYGLPTLILFKNGKEVPKSRREGTINAKKLKMLLDELLTTTTTT